MTKHELILARKILKRVEQEAGIDLRLDISNQQGLVTDVCELIRAAYPNDLK